MKNTTYKISLIIFLFLGFATLSQAQETDSTTVKKDKDISIPGKKENGRLTTFWGGLKIGLNGYGTNGKLNLPNDLDNLELNYGRSVEVTLPLLKQRIQLDKKDRIRLFYGPELNFKFYNFTNNVTLIPGGDQLVITEDAVDYKKNRLHTFVLSSPLLLDFKTKQGKGGNSFNFAAGMYGGVVLGANQKQKSKEFGKVRVKDDFNLNKFNYGLMAKVGSGPVSFYAKYSLNSMFKDGQGPELYPFSVGINILTFD